MTLGYQFRGTGQFEQSFREYADALGMAYRLLDDVIIVEALENLGVVTERLGNIQSARSFYHLALQQQDNIMTSRIVQPTPELAIKTFQFVVQTGRSRPSLWRCYSS